MEWRGIWNGLKSQLFIQSIQDVNDHQCQENTLPDISKKGVTMFNKNLNELMLNNSQKYKAENGIYIY